jgi:cytochrome c oxidase accessory protein FixG
MSEDQTLTSHPGAAPSFRDELGIVTGEGKRNWIYPKQPRGFYTRMRTILSTLLLVVLVGTPFLTINGHPLMLFNVIERKFILFGVIFGPHDFPLLGLSLITLAVFIILFTAVFGRLFCGWVCPQTVFMEMVFRRIDYWVEGDFRAQRRLRASRWTREKTLRKGTKYALYAVLSFVVANILLGWIIGGEALLALVTDDPSRHLGGLTAILVFTGGFYWIFAWFREQACILVCPYGRLQGVLLDPHSIVIAYDYVRGEPRGKLRRAQMRTEGDCIDCRLCVDVCPTGIDIRNGTQLECVNCTACMDACDAVMDKIGKPRRLIRYDSSSGIASGQRRIWTPRVLGYSALLAVLASLLVVLLANRSDIDVTILRTPGMFYQEQPDGRLSNIYDVSVLNKTFDCLPVDLTLRTTPGELRMIGDPLSPRPQELAQGKIMVLLDRSRLEGLSTPVVIDVSAGGRRVASVSTTFLGPGTVR